MAHVTRHAGAPYVDGETLAGADLETDIANLVAAVNGGLDDTNLAAGAISGTKLADGSVTTVKMGTDAATGKAMAYTAGSQGGTSTYVVVATGSLTTYSTAGPVLVIAQAIVVASVTTTTNVQLFRNGVEVGSVYPVAATETVRVQIIYIDPAPSGSTIYTYDLKVRSGGGAWTATERALAVVELRR